MAFQFEESPLNVHPKLVHGPSCSHPTMQAPDQGLDFGDFELKMQSEMS